MPPDAAIPMANGAPHITIPARKSSTHRKAWLNRIARSSRPASLCTSFYSSLTTFLAITLLLFSPAASAQIATDGGSGSFVMPWAFDAAVGNNFTQNACKTWFTNFVNEIKPCHAVSLMLQTSVSFFDATKSLVTITRALDTSCAVDYNKCSTMMSSFATELVRSDTCQQDYKLQNPTLTQAYAGLLAYQPIYGATCLKATSTTAAPSASATETDGGGLGGEKFRRQESSTGGYCYASAITNTTSPSASYFYYLPLGIGLPGGTIPACDSCLQGTMKGFAAYATNASQPLANTYTSAASDVNMFCGPTFVNQNVASGAEGLPRPWTAMLWGIAGVVAVWFMA